MPGSFWLARSVEAKPLTRLLILVGPPGAGKTQIGLALAKSFNFTFEDIESQLIKEYGSRDAFLAKKGTALKAIERRVRELAAKSQTPVVVESTGLSDRPMILRLERDYVVRMVRVLASKTTCVGRVAQRPRGCNLDNDPQAAGDFFDYWMDTVRPQYRFDLEVDTQTASPERSAAFIFQQVSWNVNR